MSAKIGFGYSIFGTNKFGETAETSDFNTKAADTSADYNIRFLFIGHVYDEYVLHVTPIRISTNLEPSSCQITLANADGKWNNIITYGYVGHRAQVRIGIYFTGIVGIKYLLTGYVDEARFEDDVCVLHIRDKITDALDKPIGTGHDEEDWAATFYTPQTMAWYLCEQYGDFDGSFGDANEDLNYPEWQVWGPHCNIEGYNLRGRFAGQEVRSALLLIGKLTNSVFYVNGEGKITPKMFRPPYSSSSYVFDVDNCLTIDVSVQSAPIKNSIQVKYGEDMYRYDETISTLAKTDSSSYVLYGRRTIAFESRIIWHNNQWSADHFAAAYLNHWENALESISLQTILYGILIDPAEVIRAQDTLKNLDHYYWPEIIEYDLEECLVRISGRRADI